MTTKINFNQIKGSVINIFDYLTAAQIAAVQAKSYASATDVGAEINAALTAARDGGAGTGRKTVFFPEGYYKHSATLQTNAVSVEGEGKEGTRFYYTGATYAITNTTGGNRITGITLDGTYQTGSGAWGILYEGTLRAEFAFNNVFAFSRGMVIKPPDSPGGTAAYGVSVHNNYFAANATHLYTLATSAARFPTANWFWENEFITGGSATVSPIFFEDGQDFTFERNIIQGNPAKYALTIYRFNTTYGNAYGNHIIRDNYWELNGVGIVGSAHIRVIGNAVHAVGNIIEGNHFLSTNGDDPTYCVEAEYTDSLSVINNFWNFGTPWIFLNKVSVNNKNWFVSNPQVPASAISELHQHAAIVRPAIAQTIAAGATTKIVLDTAILNDSGLWNLTTSLFTCRKAGKYRVDLTAYIQDSDAAQPFNFYVYLNGAPMTLYITGLFIKQTVATEQFYTTGFVTLALDDTISFYCNNAGGSGRNIGTPTQAAVTLVS